MGLGIFFGFIAFYDPGESWVHNRVFDRWSSAPTARYTVEYRLVFAQRLIAAEYLGRRGLASHGVGEHGIPRLQEEHRWKSSMLLEGDHRLVGEDAWRRRSARR